MIVFLLTAVGVLFLLMAGAYMQSSGVIVLKSHPKYHMRFIVWAMVLGVTFLAAARWFLVNG